MSECYCGVDRAAQDAAREARAESADALALADALAEAAGKALDGMDQAGGNRDGMPECPWCGSQDAEWHEPDCGLVLARAALAAYRESRR